MSQIRKKEAIWAIVEGMSLGFLVILMIVGMVLEQPSIATSVSWAVSMGVGLVIYFKAESKRKKYGKLLRPQKTLHYFEEVEQV